MNRGRTLRLTSCEHSTRRTAITPPLTVHGDGGADKSWVQPQGPLEGVLGAQDQIPSRGEEHRGENAGEHRREHPRRHDSRNPLHEGERVALRVPVCTFHSSVSHGHPYYPSHGRVRGGDRQLEVGGEKKPEAGGVDHAAHAVH